MTIEVQWSELQRDPKGVAALADQGDVRIRRRDGVPLLLVRKTPPRLRPSVRSAPPEPFEKALAYLPADDAVAGLTEEFRWLDILPDADRRPFATDFVRAVQASAELGRWSVLAQVIVEWRGPPPSTPMALAEELSRPLDDDLGPVPAPAGS